MVNISYIRKIIFYILEYLPISNQIFLRVLKLLMIFDTYSILVIGDLATKSILSNYGQLFKNSSPLISMGR